MGQRDCDRLDELKEERAFWERVRTHLGHEESRTDRDRNIDEEIYEIESRDRK